MADHTEYYSNGNIRQSWYQDPDGTIHFARWYKKGGIKQHGYRRDSKTVITDRWHRPRETPHGFFQCQSEVLRDGTKYRFTPDGKLTSHQDLAQDVKYRLRNPLKGELEEGFFDQSGRLQNVLIRHIDGHRVEETMYQDDKKHGSSDHWYGPRDPIKSWRPDTVKTRETFENGSVLSRREYNTTGELLRKSLFRHDGSILTDITFKERSSGDIKPLERTPH